jgi:uncharacterized damage-inducible protein DinB
MSPPSAELRDAGRNRSAAEHGERIRAFYPFWDEEYRPFLIRTVEIFPPEHLHFKPRPGMFTAHQMILHIAETERGWVHNAIDGGSYEEWVVPHQDPAQGWVSVVDAPDHDALLERLETWHRPTQRWLDQPASELDRVITRVRQDGAEQRYTLHWILDHVQGHEIHHRAQLFLYLRLLGIAPPEI